MSRTWVPRQGSERKQHNKGSVVLNIPPFVEFNRLSRSLAVFVN